MAGATYDREKYKVAIPQLDAKLKQLLDENVTITKQTVNIVKTVEDLDEDYETFKSLATGYFTAIAGDVDYLTSRQAYIAKLSSDIAEFGFLTADSAEIESLKVGNLEIGGVPVNIYDFATDASRRATYYLKDMPNGVFVHAEDSNQQISPTDADAHGVYITDQVDIIRNGESVAMFGETARIGKDDSNITITSDGISGKTNSNTVFDVRLNDESVSTWRNYSSYNRAYEKQAILTLIDAVDGSIATVQVRAYTSNGNGSVTTTVTIDNSAGHTYNITCPMPFGNPTMTLSTMREINGKQKWIAEWDDPSIFPQPYPIGPSDYYDIRLKYQQITDTAPSFAFGSFGEDDVNGAFSVVEGLDARANGECSHAQNRGTVATSDNQTAIGTFNEEDDSDTYAFIVGNGSDDSNRSNALTVDWNGNTSAAGTLRAKTEAITPTITSITPSTASVYTYRVRRFGNVVMVILSVRNTAAVAAGSMIFQATLGNVPLPPWRVTSACYFGYANLMAQLDEDGVVTLRNTWTQSLTIGSTNYATFSFTYIVD